MKKFVLKPKFKSIIHLLRDDSRNGNRRVVVLVVPKA